MGNKMPSYLPISYHQKPPKQSRAARRGKMRNLLGNPTKKTGITLAPKRRR